MSRLRFLRQRFERYSSLNSAIPQHDPSRLRLVVQETLACLKLNGTSIWSHAECVAAATCQGTRGVVINSQCNNHNVAHIASIPNLSGAVYATIVGSAAAAANAPITQQNYIDFVFGQMSAASVTQWPTADYVVSNWWTPITTWAATGNSVPYSNFNDWLHYSETDTK
ncbi:hypothetical protein C8F04DRAFT_1403667 [Mycena alexandri]|uniref:Uncharacterized protein n=1 Tax=Mycena alexandri TaxID=1745969 RepID=A0AAD6S354_9AGAR|nr:hypothetical protein C8F04DRAFT_1403667 [Mycena alexandri]